MFRITHHNRRPNFRRGRRPLVGVTTAVVGLLASVLSLVLSPTTAGAAGLSVTTCDEASLRSAVSSAAAGDTITFGCSGRIVLTPAGGGTLQLPRDLTIDGGGQTVAISGGGAVGVIDVQNGAVVTLRDLTITDGANTAISGAWSFAGISNLGDLTLIDVSVTGNSSPDGTGGIVSGGALRLEHSLVEGNSGLVAGIHAVAGTVDIVNTTVRANIGMAPPIWSVGGLHVNSGTVSISGSTFARNSGALAGAIRVAMGASLSVSNSTLNGNWATTWNESAGAILLEMGSTADLDHVTIADNAATYCTGCDNQAIDAGGILNMFGTLTLRNTILDGNLGLAGNCRLNMGATDAGGNLSSDAGCGFTNATSANEVTNLNLGVLSGNGGPTPTMALLDGSAAIDSAACSRSVDQRGLSRPGVGGVSCDSGAFEVQGEAPDPEPELLPQELTFASTPPTGAVIGDSYLVEVIPGGSGEGLIVSVDEASIGVCQFVTALEMLFIGSGTCAIHADQAGNDEYLPAPRVTQSFSVGMVSQTITFDPLGDITYGDPDPTVTATASSGLPVALATDGPCGVSGTTITVTGAGTCTVHADQAGNDEYLPAATVDRSFTIAALDTTAPTLTATQNPAENGSGWNSTDVTVTWACTDTESGANPAASELGDDVLTTSGTAEASCVDHAGNSVVAAHGVRIDRAAPDVTLTIDDSSASAVAVTFSASDDGSGIEDVSATIDYGCGPVRIASGDIVSADGTYVLVMSATDLAGNETVELQEFTVGARIRRLVAALDRIESVIERAPTSRWAQLLGGVADRLEARIDRLAAPSSCPVA